MEATSVVAHHWTEYLFSSIQAIAAIATVVAVIVAVIAIRESRAQFEKVRRDERVRTSLAILKELGSDEFRGLVERADPAMVQFLLQHGTADLDEPFITQHATPIHLVLNRIENRCLELMHEVADIDVARMHYRRTLNDYWQKYQPYVAWFRMIRSQPGAYGCFEAVVRDLKENES